MSRETEAVFIATLIGMATAIVSLGGALLLNIGPQPLPQPLGAAWGWAIGAATVLWWMPWVKQAIPQEVSDA